MKSEEFSRLTKAYGENSATKTQGAITLGSFVYHNREWLESAARLKDAVDKQGLTDIIDALRLQADAGPTPEDSWQSRYRELADHLTTFRDATQ